MRRRWRPPSPRKVLAIDASAVRSTVDIVLEAFTVLLEAKGLATLAPKLVDPLRRLEVAERWLRVVVVGWGSELFPRRAVLMLVTVLTILLLMMLQVMS